MMVSPVEGFPSLMHKDSCIWEKDDAAWVDIVELFQVVPLREYIPRVWLCFNGR